MKKIVILDAYAANPGDISWEEWKYLGCEFVTYGRTAPEEVLERSRGAEIILTNKVLITREVMDALPELRYVGVLATGYNVVDTAAAHEKGIVVTNIPAYSTMSVAQMVFAHLLNITNTVEQHSQAVHAGKWQTNPDFCFWLTPQEELAGKTFGVLGLGNTGTATARIALAFGMKVLAFTSKSDEQLKALLGEGATRAADLDTLFRESDVLSLHCPLTDTTKHVVNAKTLAMMKPTAVLVNTGRGPLIDEAALAEALRNGTLAAAAADVLTQEAPRDGSPLIGCPNMHITPHIAWATTAARQRLMAIALDNVRAYLNGAPQNMV